MDSELVSSSLPEKSGSGQKLTAPPDTYTESFEKLCPYYMSFGMTYDEYWNGDPCMAKFFREAHRIKMSQKNTEMWIMGAYIYEAICDVSPILNANAKKGTKPLPWRKEPIPITKEEIEAKKERDMKEKYEINKRRFEMMMALNNKRFESR